MQATADLTLILVLDRSTLCCTVLSLSLLYPGLVVASRTIHRPGL